MSLHVIADHMASKGRGPDSMLIHMAPSEVRGLQALAQAHGGSLTINPETGLPEAGFLDKLLPAILGFAITAATGIPAWQVGLGIGAVETARTGDLGKGITAGLGAYGGAGLGAGFATAGASQLAGEALLPAATEQAALEGVKLPADYAQMAARSVTPEQIAAAKDSASAMDLMSKGVERVSANPMDFANKDNFKYLGAAAAPILADEAVKSNLPTTVTKPGMIAPYSYDPYSGRYTAYPAYEAGTKSAADGGLMSIAPGATQGGPVEQMSQGIMGGQGNMFPQSQQERTNFATPTQMPASAEVIKSDYDAKTNPYTGVMMAGGGDVTKKKKQAADLTPESKIAAYDPYNAGIAMVNNARNQASLTGVDLPPAAMKTLGGVPVAASGGLADLGGYSDGGRLLKGPGDGMSDNIPAQIGRKQPARLADGEFVVPADVVSHLGNGSTDAGAKRLYAMMDKVRQARTGKKKQAPAVNTQRMMPA